MNIFKFLFNTINSNEKEESNNSIGIQLSGERLKKEEQKCTEIAEETINDAIESGYFKNEFLPIFSKKIRSVSKIGCSYSDPFDKSDFLSLEEKKVLNLNTRAKYSRELINGLTDKGIKAANNKDFIKNMFFRNFHKVSRKYELFELKELGLKYVIISDCNDERDCKAIKRLKKRWLIDEVPELPLPSCTSDYCRCMYIADEKELLND